MDKMSFGLNGAILSRKYLWKSVLKGNAANSTRYSMFKSVGEYAHYMHVVKKKEASFGAEDDKSENETNLGADRKSRPLPASSSSLH